MKSWSFDGIEVLGQSLQAIVAGFQEANTLAGRILLKEGIGRAGPDGKVKVEPEVWYPIKNALRAFREVGELVGEIMQYEIGLKVPENAPFPPAIVDADSALRLADIAYHMNHRKDGKVLFDSVTGQLIEGGIGHYAYQRTPGKKEGLMICDNPYPCPFDHGLIAALTRRVQSGVWVFHADAKQCRKNGADRCIYSIKWT